MIRSIKKTPLKSTASTADFAKNYLTTLEPNDLIVVSASEQTKGRGTSSRSWHSPKDVNLYLTFAFSLDPTFRYAANLSQMMSVMVIDYFETKGIFLSAKWPNDLLLNQKKIGGILTEVISKGHLPMLSYSSLGFNVNMDSSELEYIDQRATSLYLETRQLWDIETLKEDLSSLFAFYLSRLEQNGFATFRAKYEQSLHLLGQEVILKKENTTITGIFKGVDEEGRLLVQEGTTIHGVTLADRLFSLENGSLKQKDRESH